MSAPGKILKLDEVVVNRIAAGEVIQRPANALKELIENSLDAKATNIQIITKEGGLKLLQIQDNGTGIRKDDMDIVCERFTTSKLHTFDDLQSISTFGFRGEALASMSHVALLTITTKTVDEKCAYKASYIDSKLKAPPKPCAGNQGTTIMIENLFYNVATRRKALSNPTEEFNRILDVVTKYAIHNPTVGFVLKKHGAITPQVRTPHNSTKMSNVRILYGNPVSRELLEIELDDETYEFKMHALITNPNYTNKRIVFLLFINNRLVDCSSIHKMLEDLYSFYLPKKAHPWCYISLDINPHNVDVNVHPTKHEVKFLHESSIVERIRFALDEKLSASSASRTFYVQARLPKSDVTEEALKAVLPEYETANAEKSKKNRPQDMIRTDTTDQKLDKFNFTIHGAMMKSRIDYNVDDHESVDHHLESHRQELNESASNETTDNDTENRIGNNSNSKNADAVLCLNTSENIQKEPELLQVEKPTANDLTSPWSNIVNDTSPSTISEMITTEDGDVVTSTQKNDTKNAHGPDSMQDIFEIIDKEFTENTADDSIVEQCKDEVADKARKRVHQYFGNSDMGGDKSAAAGPSTSGTQTIHHNTEECTESTKKQTEANVSEINKDKSTSHDFKSYSVNTFRREVKLTSILKLRKEVEDDCHEGLKHILSNLIFVGCVDESSALIQSGVNLYICNTTKLVEDLFYQIMLYDFANYGVIKFSEPIPLYDVAIMGLDTEEAGWTEEDGSKEELATNVKELLLEKADMMKEYFSMVIDKKGNLKSLPLILEKYFPSPAGLPLYLLRLATEVEWSVEQQCFRDICRETAKYYSEWSPVNGTHDWKHVTEHVLYQAIKESLLPLKQYAHDSTILKIASLPDLYKVFERC